MFAFFFKRNHTFDTEKRGCVKTLAQPPFYLKPFTKGYFKSVNNN